MNLSLKIEKKTRNDQIILLFLMTKHITYFLFVHNLANDDCRKSSSRYILFIWFCFVVYRRVFCTANGTGETTQRKTMGVSDLMPRATGRTTLTTRQSVGIK